MAVTRRGFLARLGLGALALGWTPAVRATSAPAVRPRVGPESAPDDVAVPICAVVLSVTPSVDSIGQARHLVTLYPGPGRGYHHFYYISRGTLPAVGDLMVYRNYRWEPLAA